MKLVRVTGPPVAVEADATASRHAADEGAPQGRVARSAVSTKDAGGAAAWARERRVATTRTDTLKDALRPSANASAASEARSATAPIRHVVMRPH